MPYITQGAVNVSVNPRYHSTGDSIIYNGNVDCRVGQGGGYDSNTFQAVHVRNTRQDGATHYPAISLTLLVDGEFQIGLYNWRELSGAFRNPPSDAPMPSAVESR